ncbi:MAG: DNA polymerase/3'-5' exonuclease PolX [Thermoplasmatales archaeon]|nr:DNA polymerase/3'-5' exonuclease PolX [Thermoplasmatales archaeon]
MKNKELADIFADMASFESLEESENARFKTRAYQKVAAILDSLQEDIAEIYKKGGVKALMEIPGIGKAIAEKIEEYLTTGKISKYEEYKEKYPIDFKELTKIEGLGTKTALSLYKDLGIKNLADLKDAISKHEISKLPGFGVKSEELLDKGVKQLESSKGRLLLSEALPVAQSIAERLRKSGLADKVEIAGSTRRMRDTIGDIDILAIGTSSSEIMDFFTGLEDVERTVVKGPSKTTVYLKIGTTCDLRVIEPGRFGAAMQYFTGSKDHNIQVRKVAIDNGYKLNEYGLYDRTGKMVSGVDEQELYNKLGMDWIPPEMRENRGEIELAMKHKLPNLIQYSSLRGDLHTHTKDTDGSNTLEEMVEYARKYGLEYIATTNHTKSLKVARGMDEARFADYFSKVDRLNEELGKDFHVLKGAEVDILKDGSLDLENKTLREMECVVASVHSNFNMSKDEMTKRAITALDSGYVNILGHPTGRLINERPPFQIDLEKVAESAEANKVILEINAFPTRLDLKDTDIMLTSKFKVNYAIDSDAHNISHYNVLKYGIGTARRGWLESDRVVNTFDLSKALRMLKK